MGVYVVKGKGKGKDKVHPRTDHEAQRGRKGIAVLFVYPRR
jgi:hypothetical protein